MPGGTIRDKLKKSFYTVWILCTIGMMSESIDLEWGWSSPYNRLPGLITPTAEQTVGVFFTNDIPHLIMLESKKHIHKCRSILCC